MTRFEPIFVKPNKPIREMTEEELHARALWVFDKLMEARDRAADSRS